MTQLIWEDDLGAEVDEEAIMAWYERLCELFDIETTELPNGNTITVMLPRKQG